MSVSYVSIRSSTESAYSDFESSSCLLTVTDNFSKALMIAYSLSYNPLLTFLIILCIQLHIISGLREISYTRCQGRHPASQTSYASTIGKTIPEIYWLR